MSKIRSEYIEMTKRPTLQLMATMACNLRCNYCPVEQWLLDNPNDGLLEDPKVLDFFENARDPLYVYFGGGEPLLNPSIVDFVSRYGKMGHRFSFDTNGTHNKNVLSKILDQWDPEWLGYFDISHHIDQKVPVQTILNTSKVMRERGMNHYVKNIGRPCDIETIDKNVKTFEDNGIGTWVSVYLGANIESSGEKIDDRILPADYTDSEIEWLLGHLRIRTHIPGVFGGMAMKGVPCIGGHEYLYIGEFENDYNKVWPCCHGQNLKVDVNKTYFGGCGRGKKPCQVDTACFNYAGFEHGMIPDIEEYLSDLFVGPVKPLDPQKIVDYLEQTCLAVAPPSNQILFDRVLAAAKRMCN